MLHFLHQSIRPDVTYMFRLPHEKLKSITIPSTVKSIGEDAFSGSGLETFVIPNGIKKIENHTFNGCTHLKKITVPNTVTSIGEYAFAGCTALKTISLPRSLRTIGPEAFSGTGLRAITIPEGVTKLGTEPFNDCTHLKSISLPSTLKRMGLFAFGSPVHIKSIKVNKKNRWFSSKNGVLFNKKKTKLLFYPARGKAVYVPKTVKTIGKSAFMDPRIKTIKLSSNVRVIGPYAFAYCTRLNKVTLSQKLRKIGASAFSYCEHLNSLTIPKNVTEIGPSAFEGCSRLKKITIKTKKLKSNKVGKNAFRWIHPKVAVEVPGGKKSLYKSILRERGLQGKIK